MNRVTSTRSGNPTRVFRIDAAGVADGLRVSSAPGTLLIETDDRGVRVLFAGAPGEADHHPAARDALRVSMPTRVITPAFVNAHTHLDLTHVGPRDHSPADGFVSWIRMVIRERASDPDAIRVSVRDGLARSVAGGVVAVGDIVGGGSPVAHEESLRAGVGGVSYMEVFGIGRGEARGREEAIGWARRSAADAGASRLGVSPHAPYSAGRGVFGESDVAGAMACAHVAESIEERELVREGTGPFRAFLESIGVWNEGVLEWLGRGAHPIDLALESIGGAPHARWLFAHVNDCEDAHIARLREAGVSVAYCARGHTYFGHAGTLGAHRWREMLEGGVNVCLATDSVINLPRGEGSARISPLDEARHVWRSGAREAGLLLRMITSNPAKALGLDTRQDLSEGKVAGLVGVEVGEIRKGVRAEEAVMASGGGVAWVTRGARPGEMLSAEAL